jgi:hypothetical protein
LLSRRDGIANARLLLSRLETRAKELIVAERGRGQENSEPEMKVNERKRGRRNSALHFCWMLSPNELGAIRPER